MVTDRRVALVFGLLAAFFVLVSGISLGSKVAEAGNGVAAINPDPAAVVGADGHVGPAHVGSETRLSDDETSGCCVAPKTVSNGVGSPAAPMSTVRILASVSPAGAIRHDYDGALFTYDQPVDVAPGTWGEAVTQRIESQKSGWRSCYPMGAPFTCRMGG